MRSNLRRSLTIFIPIIALLIPVQGWAHGIWKKDDCQNISEASGFLLKMSGDLLKESDEARKNDSEIKADKLAGAALYLSNLSTNYAKNFEVFCK